MPSYPRVEWLHYDLVLREPERDSIRLAEPQNIMLGDFDCTLSGTRLRAVPTGDMSVAEAWNSLEPLLRAWAVRIEARSGIPLTFEDAGALEAQGPPANRRVEYGPAAYATATPRPEPERRTLTKLPPPMDFSAESPSLWALQWRVQEYREGRDRLLALGYFAYLTFTTAFGGKHRVPAKMRVESPILEQLDYLTSQRLHFVHGRKALDPGRNLELSPSEAQWVERAVVVLMHRMYEIESSARDLEPITMGDLPQLPPREGTDVRQG